MVGGWESGGGGEVLGDLFWVCIELLGGGRWPLSGGCGGLGWGCGPYFGGGGAEWGTLLVVWCPVVRGVVLGGRRCGYVGWQSGHLEPDIFYNTVEI